MTKMEKAEQKRARRRARNERHPGAFSEVQGPPASWRRAVRASVVRAAAAGALARRVPALLSALALSANPPVRGSAKPVGPARAPQGHRGGAR